MRIADMFMVLFVLQVILSPVPTNGKTEVSDSFSFPSNFLFGTGTSAYQHEGAYLADGKGLNNWDVFTHLNPGKTNGSNGDVATDHYHRYLEDINLMASLGVNSFRFSISWARILPKGRFGSINFAGINHYKKVIDALLSKGIQPFVTLTHFDYPQELEDRYKSWLSPESQKDFVYYSDICFKYFGDRVKYWVTLNEPNFQTILSYLAGWYPPSRCSLPFGNCTQGNSQTEPFIVAHNMILAHARSVYLYRTKYQRKQGGSIGMVMHAMWFEPYSNSSADRLAAERAQSFLFNWLVDPLFFGRYPLEMQAILGPVLPRFSKIEKRIIKNTLDFIGINHYSSFYVQDCLTSPCKKGFGASKTEGYARKTGWRNGVPIGNATDIIWIYAYPEGMRKTVNYVKGRYHNIPMFITENGFGENRPNATLQELLHDVKRADYLSAYLDSLKTSIREGANVRGYFAWSLLDNIEWVSGSNIRFGLFHVDFKTLKRTPKYSAAWYKDFIANHTSVKFRKQ